MAKKSGKSGRKSGKTSAVSKRGKSGKQSGKHKRSTGRSSAVSRKAAPRPAGHLLIDVVCSECFGEFSFDTSTRSEELECPVCGHVSGRPEDGTLSKVASLAKGEKTNFMITFILLLLILGSFGAWGVLNVNPLNASKDEMFTAPLAVAGLASIVLMVFIFKYEKNRWETYF